MADRSPGSAKPVFAKSSPFAPFSSHVAARPHLFEHGCVHRNLCVACNLLLHPVEGALQIINGRAGFQIGILVLEQYVRRAKKVE